MTFKELKVDESILEALTKKGYSVPTPIQEVSIPMILEGKDILGCASTGTGKTAAFAIPIIQNILKNGVESKKKSGYRPIKALVLTPTRELALQIATNFTEYSYGTKIKNCVVFGGVNQKPQVSAIRGGVDILIATPGRLLDLMRQGIVHLDKVQYLVLDEADRMLDMGFIHDVKKIVSYLPTERQTMFFSATLQQAINSFAESVLSNPIVVDVEKEEEKNENIEQFLYMVDKNNKKELLVNILKEESEKSVLVFSRTKHGADKIAKELCRKGIDSEAIHGNKSQNARQNALNKFKKHQTKVLVATDVAARGLDIQLLPMVINFDMPDVPETYIHRIGRTGRAGNVGVALSFCEPHEKGMIRSIQKLTGKVIMKRSV